MTKTRILYDEKMQSFAIQGRFLSFWYTYRNEDTLEEALLAADAVRAGVHSDKIFYWMAQRRDRLNRVYGVGFRAN